MQKRARSKQHRLLRDASLPSRDREGAVLYQMNLNLLVLPGDGIGPEVTQAAMRVLGVVAQKWGHTLNIREGLLGGVAIDATGSPFPAETECGSREADAVFMGAVGAPKFDALPPLQRPKRKSSPTRIQRTPSLCMRIRSMNSVADKDASATLKRAT